MSFQRLGGIFLLAALLIGAVMAGGAAESRSLAAALKAAKGGDVIALPGGHYGVLTLDGLDFAAPVTVKSADRKHPAVFSEGSINGSRNITLDGLVIDYKAAPGAEIWEMPFSVWNSKNITLRNMLFDGDRVGGYGSGRGLFVANCDDVVVEGSEFREWHTAAIFTTINRLYVRDNDVHSIRSDGFDFVEITTGLIERNHIHDFRANMASGDHTDMIQFWTEGAEKPTTDIIIRRNILEAGSGNWTQSIFMANEQGSRRDMYYRDILISNNVISNAHLHGISVGEAEGVIIENNTVLQNRNAAESGDEVWIPQINVVDRATNVMVINNVAAAVPRARAGLRVSGNLIVQNRYPGRQDYYARQFSGALDPAPGLAGLKARPGSAVAKHRLGSDLTR